MTDQIQSLLDDLGEIEDRNSGEARKIRQALRKLDYKISDHTKKNEKKKKTNLSKDLTPANRSATKQEKINTLKREISQINEEDEKDSLFLVIQVNGVKQERIEIPVGSTLEISVE